MAKLLMSCDDYVYCYQNKYYARTQEKYDFYQRYLRVFDQLRLVTRCVVEETLGKTHVPLDQDPRIEYVPIPFFSGPIQYAKKYFEIDKVTANIAEGCDAAILRLPSTVAQRVCDQVMKAGIPYATELVYDAKDGYEGESNIIHKLLWLRIHHQMKCACAKADGVACVTEQYLQKHYYSMKKENFKSHYSSLALDKSFYTTARKFPPKEVFSISHVCTQVQYNGRKGHNEIIKAIKLLKDEGLKVEIRFAGPDYHNGIALLSNLTKRLGVEDRVFFIGGLNRLQLSQYLEESDLYVMPTRAEGLPRVIIEAMAKGLPCITTPVSGNPELVEQNFLVKYEDVKVLAAKIKLLVTNKTIYEEQSQLNFEKSRQYEASILQSRRDDFYYHLLNCTRSTKRLK